MSTPGTLETPTVARKRKRQLIERLEWEATVIDHQEIKEEEQAHTEWLRQCEVRKKTFHVKKQKVLEKVNKLRNDGPEEEEPCLSDSDVEIIGKNIFKARQKPIVKSRVDSGRPVREARKDNPISSVEFSQVTRTQAPTPPVAPTPAPASNSASAPPPAEVAAIILQAVPFSSQPSFTPIRPPMSYLLKLKLEKLKSATSPPKGEYHTSDSKRRKLPCPHSLLSPKPSQPPRSSQTSLPSLSPQSSQLSQSMGVTSKATQVGASKNVSTSVASPKPVHTMLAPSRNTKRLSFTPKNTPAAIEQAPPTAPETVSEVASEIVPEIFSRPAPATAPQATATPTRREPGRPKGVKNKPKPVQQAAVADCSGSISWNQGKAWELPELENNAQNLFAGYLEVEAPAEGKEQPDPNQAVTERSHRNPLQKANKRASVTKEGQFALPKSTAVEAAWVTSTAVPRNAAVGGPAGTTWVTVNGPQPATAIASNSAEEIPRTLGVSIAASLRTQQGSKIGKGKEVGKPPPKAMQLIIRASSKVCFSENGDIVTGSHLAAEDEGDLCNQPEETANHAQEKAKKGQELRAQQKAEEEAKELDARRPQGDSDEEAKHDAARRVQLKAQEEAEEARRAQKEAQEKAARRLDELARRAKRRRERSRAGRDASEMRPDTPLGSSGTTHEIERMKARSIVVLAAEFPKKGTKSRPTNEIPAQTHGSTMEAPREKKTDKATIRVSRTPATVDKERSVAPQRIDVLGDWEPTPYESVHEELLDAIDKMGEAKAVEEDGMDSREMVPLGLEQSSKTVSVEPVQNVLLASVQDRRPVFIADLPTPPASQGLFEPSIESGEQEDATTPPRQAGSSTIATLTTLAGAMAALPLTPSCSSSGGPSSVMHGVISRLTIKLPEEMQKKVVEYVLSTEKTISELTTPPEIYTAHPTTPAFQMSGHPSAMWHEVITTLAVDLSEEQQKAVVEYILALKNNKKQNVRSKTIG